MICDDSKELVRQNRTGYNDAAGRPTMPGREQGLWLSAFLTVALETLADLE